jgi:hypothetical protein
MVMRQVIESLEEILARLDESEHAVAAAMIAGAIDALKDSGDKSSSSTESLVP